MLLSPGGWPWEAIQLSRWCRLQPSSRNRCSSEGLAGLLSIDWVHVGQGYGWWKSLLVFSDQL
jgi:hypothetical protein